MKPENVLEVQDLHAWYGESHVLHGVHLAVSKGETVSLLGRNGAGKTTTLKTIMGLLRRRTGRIAINGADLLMLPLHHVARCGLGYVPEERGIFPSLSVLENLMLPPRVAAGGFGVDEIFSLFPNLAERRHSQGTKLSGGEQQMLAIARILRTGATVLLLDEISEGLAPVVVQQLARTILDLKARGYTILMVEQNFGFARRIADRFYVMEEGMITASFSHDELPERTAMLHEALGL